MARADNGFGPDTTTDEVLAGVDLTGKVVLVTGASGGLGLETTRSLASHGATVVMAVRDMDKGEQAMVTVRAGATDARLELRRIDLGSLASIRTFAHDVLADRDNLDVLIANAGVMACPLGYTDDGFEMQLGTNHLGHFLLVGLLAPLLVAGAPSRLAQCLSASRPPRRTRRSVARLPWTRRLGPTSIPGSERRRAASSGCRDRPTPSSARSTRVPEPAGLAVLPRAGRDGLRPACTDGCRSSRRGRSGGSVHGRQRRRRTGTP